MQVHFFKNSALKEPRIIDDLEFIWNFHFGINPKICFYEYKYSFITNIKQRCFNIVSLYLGILDIAYVEREVIKLGF